MAGVAALPGHGRPLTGIDVCACRLLAICWLPQVQMHVIARAGTERQNTTVADLPASTRFTPLILVYGIRVFVTVSYSRYATTRQSIYARLHGTIAASPYFTPRLPVSREGVIVAASRAAVKVILYAEAMLHLSYQRDNEYLDCRSVA